MEQIPELKDQDHAPDSGHQPSGRHLWLSVYFCLCGWSASGAVCRQYGALFEKFGFDNESAIHLYRAIFWDNKTMIISTGFIFLFLCSFYLGMSRFTTYLRQIESGIDMILTDSSDLIELEPELQPMENRLNEIKANLKEQRRQTQESEQRKNDLVVYLAHDLKTPLTSVIAYLSLLSEAPDMPLEQRAKYTHISLEKAKRLGDLINEFFEITRYNLQNITLEKKTFYLYVLLEQVLDSFEPVFQERGLICRTEIEDSILIHGDPDKLARVFENLLRNGVSYCYRIQPSRSARREKIKRL